MVVRVSDVDADVTMAVSLIGTRGESLLRSRTLNKKINQTVTHLRRAESAELRENRKLTVKRVRVCEVPPTRLAYLKTCTPERAHRGV